MTRSPKVENVFLLLLYGLPLVLFFYQWLINDFSIDVLLEYKGFFLHLKNIHPVLMPMVFFGCYSMLVALSIPIIPVLNVLAGYLFGSLFGALVASVGVVSGSYLLFLFSRYTARGLRVPLPQRSLLAPDSGHNFFLLFFLRLSPVVPAPLISVGAAVVGIKDRLFLGATFLGSFPLLLVYAMIGRHLGNIEHMRDIYDSSLGYLLVMFTIITLVPLLKREVREQLQWMNTPKIVHDGQLPAQGPGSQLLEKRASVRFFPGQFGHLFKKADGPFHVSIAAKTKGQEYRGILLDISLKGMGIRISAHRFHEDEQVVLHTQFGRRVLSITAVIRWIQVDRVGLEFLDSPAEEWAFLHKIAA